MHEITPASPAFFPDKKGENPGCPSECVFLFQGGEAMNTKTFRSSGLFESVYNRILSGSIPGWSRCGRRNPLGRMIRALVAAAAVAIVAGCVPPAGGLIVNSTGDAGDSSPGDTKCRTAASATECTLRAAIEEANAWAGANTITFLLPVGDLTIQPPTALPVITGELTIDGTTQPGYTGDPIVIIDGSDLTTPLTNGLETADGSEVTLRGLQVVHATKHGIYTKGPMRLEHILAGFNMRSGLTIFGDPDPIAVTIDDSEFSDNTGAGINAANADLTITHLRATNNHFGGMALADGHLTMSASLIMDNNTPAAGGGISVLGDVHASLSTSDIYNNQATDVGGGVFFQGDKEAELSFWHCTLSGNASAQGGGLYQLGGYVNMEPGNTVIDNRADSGGGGIYLNDGTLEVGRSTIGQAGHGNDPDANHDGFGSGGGIYNDGGYLDVLASSINGNIGSGVYSLGGRVQMTVSDAIDNGRHGVEMVADGAATSFEAHQSLFRRNAMNGVFGENVDMVIVDSVFWENGAQGVRMTGGQLSFWRNTVRENLSNGMYLPLVTEADIKQTSIWGNSSSGEGGGILIEGNPGATYQFENVTLHDNRAVTTGGGLELIAGTATLNNVTISGNTAREGGGIHSTGTVNIGNSILDENPGGNCHGTITSLGYNIDHSTTCPLFSLGDQPNTAITLGPLQDNGGPTFTRAISAVSPAFDAGDDTTCAPVDQRDVPRPQAMHCDIGAFELEAGGKSASTPETGTPTETLVSTPTPTLASIVFDPVQFSSDKLFQGGKSCDPKTLTVQVKVSPSQMVSSIGVFYRIVAKQGNQSYPWGGGLAMTPQGNGWYGLTLAGNDLPSIGQWQTEAWLDFQFVANDTNNQPIAWSSVYRQVTLWQCYI
jgi:CSLREA domain-containing protein